MIPDVIGLDLSLTATGIVRNLGIDEVEMRTLTTHLRGPERMDYLETAVLDMCRGCDLVVIEDFSFGSTNRSVREIGGLGWVVRLALWRANVDMALVPPASLKKYATGRGNAPKPDVRMEVFKRFGEDIADDNQCDAFVLRAMGLDHLVHPLVKMPASHREALDKVEWPTTVGERAA